MGIVVEASPGNAPRAVIPRGGGVTHYPHPVRFFFPSFIRFALVSKTVCDRALHLSRSTILLFFDAPSFLGLRSYSRRENPRFVSSSTKDRFIPFLNALLYARNVRNVERYWYHRSRVPFLPKVRFLWKFVQRKRVGLSDSRRRRNRWTHRTVQRRRDVKISLILGNIFIT